MLNKWRLASLVPHRLLPKFEGFKVRMEEAKLGARVGEWSSFVEFDDLTAG